MSGGNLQRRVARLTQGLHGPQARLGGLVGTFALLAAVTLGAPASQAGDGRRKTGDATAL
jgi:hypothetical protein